jgi:ribosomal protein L4
LGRPGHGPVWSPRCGGELLVQAACVGVSGDSLVLEDVLWRQFPAVVLRDWNGSASGKQRADGRSAGGYGWRREGRRVPGKIKDIRWYQVRPA